MKTVSYSDHDLPVLWSGDVVVVGASLAGITAALGFARAGKKTCLVEPRTYLGRDLFSVLRPWIEKPVGMDLEDLPEIPLQAIGASGKKTVHGEYPLHPDMVKLCFEDLLLEVRREAVICQPAGGRCLWRERHCWGGDWKQIW